MRTRIYFLLISFSLTISGVSAQSFSKEYGKIGKAELELKQYALDRNAEAVVLFDIGKSYFVEDTYKSHFVNDPMKHQNIGAIYGYNIEYERTTRIKILSETGTKWTEVQIPFYKDNLSTEIISEIEATIFNVEDGVLTTTTLPITDTHDEVIDKNWSIKKFQIPHVKVGSIVEYKYNIRSTFITNLRSWEFQWRIPVVYSEYEVRIIAPYEYSFIMQGTKEFEVYEAYQDKTYARRFGLRQGGYGSERSFYDAVYKFGLKDVPAFKDEEFITSINDYIIKIHFQLAKTTRLEDGAEFKFLTTWEEFVNDLLKNKDFGRYISASKKMAKNVIPINQISKLDDREKFDAVLSFVKDNYEWNGKNSHYASLTPKQLVNLKTGNSADLNLFTIGLLNRVGIDAYPVVLSTRDNGIIKLDYPYEHYFNYVIISAHVDGKVFLADATEMLNLNNRIPRNTINDKGLVVNKKDVAWQNLSPTFTSEITTDIIIKPAETDLEVEMLKRAYEYDALYYKTNLSDNIHKIKQEIISEEYNLDETSIKVSNHLDRNKPYALQYSFNIPIEHKDDIILIAPFLKEIMSESPLKQNERKYPVDMEYPKRRVYNTTLEIPDGYTITSLPTSITINNELFELDYNTETINNTLKVNFSYHFKKAVYQPDEYGRIKTYFNRIARKGNEMIEFTRQ